MHSRFGGNDAIDAVTIEAAIVIPAAFSPREGGGESTGGHGVESSTATAGAGSPAANAEIDELHSASIRTICLTACGCPGTDP